MACTVLYSQRAKAKGVSQSFIEYSTIPLVLISRGKQMTN